MTAEQRKRQQAQYTRSLLDAVYEPDRIKRQQITETRRRNRSLKENNDQKNQRPA
jgi:hypothetical protein